MSKKQIKIHQKGEPGRLYQAPRLGNAQKNSGIKNIRKPKGGK